MTERTGRRRIQVFKPPEGLGADQGCASGTCGTCSSRSSCGEPTETFEEMLTRLYLGFGDQADIELRVLDLSTEVSRGTTIEELTRMLEARRAEVQLTEENLEEFLGSHSPLIAVDGVLFFIGVIPTNTQVQRALEIMSKQ